MQKSRQNWCREFILKGYEEARDGFRGTEKLPFYS